ncbi:MAG: hypothetical protein WC710_14490 [Gallionella sp.]|jgi:hypothetical protein
MTNPILTLEDLHSPTWRKVKEWAESELAQLRINLEADQEPERTAKLRGQIKSCKHLLNLESPQPLVADDD